MKEPVIRPLDLVRWRMVAYGMRGSIRVHKMCLAPRPVMELKSRRTANMARTIRNRCINEVEKHGHSWICSRQEARSADGCKKSA